MSAAKPLRALCLCLLLACIACPARSLQAQATGFRETFDDPAAPGWERPNGATVSDGMLHLEPDGVAFRGGRWSDLTFTVRARRIGSGVLLVNVCWSDEGRYQLRVGAEGTHLERAIGEQATLLAGAPRGMADGVWAVLVLSAGNGKLSVTLDGESLLAANDPAPLPPGGVGFTAEQGASEIDEAELAAGAPDATTTPAATAATGASVPAYQAGTWTRLGGPIGGLGYDIRYNFADHNLWYVTDAWAGLHMSTDHGLTWFTSNTGITTRIGAGAADAIPVFSATVDPLDPNIVWVGTQNSGGIFKSTDRGYTWTQKNNGIDTRIASFLSFRGFTVDPRSSATVYAMAELASAAWTPDGSARTGLETDLTQGIVYKTTDGGEHWTQIWRGDNLARYCWIDPRDSNVLYVSTGIFDREAANTDVAAGFAGGVGILKSTDAGQTWRVLNQQNGLLDLYVGSLYMHPQDPAVLLAAASQNNWSDYPADFTGGVFLTEDGGEHWQRVLTDELYSVVEYCPADPKVAYAASPSAAYRSDDGGRTWQRFAGAGGRWGPPGIIAGFPIDFQCDPDNSQQVYANNYLGGNFVSTDGGQTWVTASTGYTGALVHQVLVMPGQPQTVFAGGRTGVFRSDDGGATWAGLAYPPPEMAGIALNEISALAVDPADAAHLLAAPMDLQDLLYSADGGQSWSKAAGLPNSPVAVTFAPSDPRTVYASPAVRGCRAEPGLPAPNAAPCEQSVGDVYVSHDGGKSWTHAGNQALGMAVFAIAVHPSDPNRVFAGTYSNGVVASTDGGATWQPAGQGAPALSVRALAIDPRAPANLFAGTSQGGIYRSIDGGLTWAQSSAGLNPESIVRGLAVDPADGSVVYAGDWLSGVYVSTDSGASWSVSNDGLEHRTVNALSLSTDGTVLYAAIEGDGVYRLGMPPVVPAAPVATGSAAPVPSGPNVPPPAATAAAAPSAAPAGRGGGICGGAAALPLVLMALAGAAGARRAAERR